jgi:hypothetical protein
VLNSSFVLADTTNFSAVKEIWHEWKSDDGIYLTPRAGASAVSFSLPRKVKQQVHYPKKS